MQAVEDKLKLIPLILEETRANGRYLRDVCNQFADMETRLERMHDRRDRKGSADAAISCEGELLRSRLLLRKNDKTISMDSCPKRHHDPHVRRE